MGGGDPYHVLKVADLVIAIFLSQLLRRPAKRIAVTERLDLIRAKHPYISASAVSSPAVPYFARVACDEESDEPPPPQTAVLQAPVLCQLCGAGFVELEDLFKHAKAEHHSWAEYRMLGS